MTLRREILILFGSFFEKHSNTCLNYLTFLGRFLNIVKLHKTHKGENKTMEKNKDNDLRWLSIRLTRQNAIYLMVISSIVISYFATSIFFAVPVLYYARINNYPYDKITYTYTLLLSISNFIASAICIGIFSLRLSKAKTFRKSLKNQ